MMVAMFVLGIGGGTIVTASNTLVSDIGEEKRGSLLSFANVFFGLGGLLTPFIAANLLRGNSIGLGYLVAALAAVLLVVHATTPMPPPGPDGFHLSQALRLPGKSLLLLLSLFIFLYVACEVAVWNWLTKYLVGQGISRSLALNILGFGFASGIMFGRLIGSRLLMRYSAISVSFICSCLMVVTTYWALNSSSPAIACLSVLCAGVAMGPVYPSAMAITGDAFTQMTATCLGIVITSGWLGAAASSWFIGLIAGSNDEHLRGALLLVPAFATAMIAINLGLRPLLKRVSKSESTAAGG